MCDLRPLLAPLFSERSCAAWASCPHLFRLPFKNFALRELCLQLSLTMSQLSDCLSRATVVFGPCVHIAVCNWWRQCVQRSVAQHGWAVNMCFRLPLTTCTLPLVFLDLLAAIFGGWRQGVFRGPAEHWPAHWPLVLRPGRPLHFHSRPAAAGRPHSASRLLRLHRTQQVQPG